MSQPQDVLQHTYARLSTSPRPAVTSQNARWRPMDEIISDSEEERLNERKKTHKGACSTKETFEPSMSPQKSSGVVEPEVIEISSDTDEEQCERQKKPKPRKSREAKMQQSNTRDLFIDEYSTSRNSTVAPINSIFPLLEKGKKQPESRTLSQEDGHEIICISDVETDFDPSVPQPSGSPVKKRLSKDIDNPAIDIFDPGHSSNDPAILTFDPHVRAKPVPHTPSSKTRLPSHINENPLSSTDAPQTQRQKSVSPRKRKITTEQQRLENYATALFFELNDAVFRQRIPPDTELIWNVRLLSTAGKAFFSRNRQDQTYTKIELAPKLLDCDERVRLTLAHEMCHLAVWVIDNDPSEVGHGPQFKAWASRVTQARPDITVSTKHSYTINYTYKWECMECGKVYGRFSNSIDIETHGCSLCTPAGKLKPLFQTRGKKKAATSESKLASGSPRESPRALAPSLPKSSANPRFRIAVELSSDDEVEELIRGIGAVSIDGSS